MAFRQENLHATDVACAALPFATNDATLAAYYYPNKLDNPNTVTTGVQYDAAVGACTCRHKIVQIHQALTAGGVAVRRNGRGYMVGVALTDDNEWIGAISGRSLDAISTVISNYVDFYVTNGAPRRMIDADYGCEWTGDHEMECDHGGQIERGNVPGKCAGSKIVWAAHKRGKLLQCMAEILFAPTGAPSPKVWDEGDNRVVYADGEIVPSCVTCQNQLPSILLETAQTRQIQDQIAQAAALQKIQEEQERWNGRFNEFKEDIKAWLEDENGGWASLKKQKSQAGKVEQIAFVEEHIDSDEFRDFMANEVLDSDDWLEVRPIEWLTYKENAYYFHVYWDKIQNGDDF